MKAESRACGWEVWAAAVPTALHSGCDCSIPLRLHSGHWSFSNSQRLASTMLAASRAEPCGRVNKFCAKSCSHLQLQKSKVTPWTAGNIALQADMEIHGLHLTVLCGHWAANHGANLPMLSAYCCQRKNKLLYAYKHLFSEGWWRSGPTLLLDGPTAEHRATLWVPLLTPGCNPTCNTF